MEGHISKLASNRRWSELLLDFASSATIFSWGVVGLLREKWNDGLSVPLASLLILNSVVVFLFLSRERARSAGSVRGIAMALPSVLIGPMTLARAPEASRWPWFVAALFVLSTVWVIVSLLTLGKSFAIFPARRGLAASGPYRVVRHPAYAGELLMAVAAGAARLDLINVIVIVLAVVGTAWRIVTEERMLREDENYLAYALSVKWRLMPGVW